MTSAKKDFFISYNMHDSQIGEWIAWELEEAGYKVIMQAWDFKGNWIEAMDTAIQTCSRTIAVLSPNYVNAKYTFTEWANAFKDDPKGNEDKLVTVRITDFEPTGILGQLVYVDFVGKKEEEARELLLKRVKGMRGKPSMKPKFKLHSGSIEIKHEAVLSKPVFPAWKEDEETLKIVSQIAVQWRKKYSLQVISLEEYLNKINAWMNELPTLFSDDMDAIIKIAYQIALDFRNLPLQKLEKIQSYGLDIAYSVVTGEAFTEIFQIFSDYSQETRERHRKIAMEKGMDLKLFGITPTPRKYQFETIGRLIRSALSLAQFDIGNLPRGFIAPIVISNETNLNKYDHLFIAHIDYDPRLYLINVDDGIQKIQSFTARQLALRVLYCRVNIESKLDLLASDFEHLYVFQKSAPHPTYQFTIEKGLLCALIHKRNNHEWAQVLSKRGTLYSITEDGKLSEEMLAFEGKSLRCAFSWTDPKDSENWYIIACTDTNHVRSYFKGKKIVGELLDKEIPWQDMIARGNEKKYNWLVSEYEEPFGKDTFLWQEGSNLQMSELDGLPCLVLCRHSRIGTIICFLDPVTLGFLRHPVLVEEFFEKVHIACGRWLVIGLLQNGGLNPKIHVWDLRPSFMRICGSWLYEDGNIYNANIVSETKTSFKLIMIHHYLGKNNKNWRLISFEWPSGEINEIETFENVTIMPVSIT